MPSFNVTPKRLCKSVRSVAFEEGLTQFPFQQFAGRSSEKIGHHKKAFGSFVCRKPGFQEIFQLLWVDGSVGLREGEFSDSFAPLSVRHTDVGSFLYVRVGIQDLFHIQGVDVFSTADYHVLQSVDDEKVTVSS